MKRSFSNLDNEAYSEQPQTTTNTQLQLAGFKKNKKSQKSWVFHIESGFGGICFDLFLVEA